MSDDGLMPVFGIRARAAVNQAAVCQDVDSFTRSHSLIDAS
jgi:hypothetical protein